MNEAEVYKAALERIVRVTNEWDANRLGGVNIQRKRWERCRQIAQEALENANHKSSTAAGPDFSYLLSQQIRDK